MQIEIHRNRLLYDIESMISRMGFEIESEIDFITERILSDQVKENNLPWYKKIFFNDEKILDNYHDIKLAIQKEIDNEKIYNLNRFYHEYSMRYNYISNKKMFNANKKLKRLIRLRNMINLDQTMILFNINEDGYKLIYEM